MRGTASAVVCQPQQQGCRGTRKAAEAQPHRAGPGTAAQGWHQGSTGLVGPAQHLPPTMSNPARSSAGEPAWVQPSWGPGWLGSWPGRRIWGERGPEPFLGPCWLVPTLVPRCCWGSVEADGMVPWLVLESARTQSHWPHLHGSWPTGSGAGVVFSLCRAGRGWAAEERGQEHVCLSVSLSPPAILRSSIPGLPLRLTQSSSSQRCPQGST